MAAVDDNGEIPSINEDGLPTPGAPKEHYRSNRER